tara:strand:- start:1014 stop:1514 length:501 start_codon:yes stop_codon:yes gene_type:complete
MADLGEKLDQVEGLKDKRIKAFGLRFTGTQLVATFALVSSIASGGYGGLLLWQKVEALAQLDLGSISASMASTSEDLERVSNELDEIKTSYKDDISSMRDNLYALESRIDGKITSQDSKLTAFDQRIDFKLTSYDDRMFKLDQKIEQTKSDLNKRIQQSLDNPLAY